MGKLVVLKITDGSFAQGFSVTLQLGEDNARHSLETVGKLPAAPHISSAYDRWQTLYSQLGEPTRITARTFDKFDFSQRKQACRQAAQKLRLHLNDWLRSEEFRPIREKLLERLMPEEDIRIILQTEDPQIRRLPWNLLDFMERYPKAEIALSTLKWEQIPQPKHQKQTVNILAILGDSEGIDTHADQKLLEQVPRARVKFLPEPSRQELSDRLWQTPWDILFFAGHSSSQPSSPEPSQKSSPKANQTGRIFLNKTDSLTIGELKYALQKAVERGLQFAIFNSCDGLGLAWELADLQIPQIVVMREPVPDLVAQEFLKYFLAAFSQQKPFYLAVREARERLQGLEDRFPCASWLPVICQHPAVMPPTWQELMFSEPDLSAAVTPAPVPVKQALKTALLAALAVTGVIGGIRWAGWLQGTELKAFDHLMRQRQVLRDEGPDKRLLLVTIDDDDITKQRREEGLKAGISLSDQSLNQALKILTQYQPRAIGLDIYRDFPFDPALPELGLRLQNTKNLIGVCKVSLGKLDAGIDPPVGIPTTQVGFSDFITDGGNEVLRRQLLFMTPIASSRCQALYAFNMHLVYQYLDAAKIQPSFTADGNLQLGKEEPAGKGGPADKLVLRNLPPRASGYQDLSGTGQILLNYRDTQNIADTVSLRDLTSGRLDPESLRDAIQNRLVLIGVTARSSSDRWNTPYGSQPDQQMPGVVAQAQMISQILSAVLDGRPLLWVWPVWMDILWIGGCSVVGGVVAWYFGPYSAGRKWAMFQAIMAIGVAFGMVYVICLGFLFQGGWIPLVPSLLGLVATSSLTVTVQVLKRPKLVNGQDRR